MNHEDQEAMFSSERGHFVKISDLLHDAITSYILAVWLHSFLPFPSHRERHKAGRAAQNVFWGPGSSTTNLLCRTGVREKNMLVVQIVMEELGRRWVVSWPLRWAEEEDKMEWLWIISQSGKPIGRWGDVMPVYGWQGSQLAGESSGVTSWPVRTDATLDLGPQHKETNLKNTRDT